MATEDSANTASDMPGIDKDESEAASYIINEHTPLEPKPEEPKSLKRTLEVARDFINKNEWNKIPPEMATKLADMVNGIPYLPQQLKNSIVAAKDAYICALQEFNEAQVQLEPSVEISRSDADNELADLMKNLDDTDRSLVLSQPDKGQQLRLAKRFALLGVDVKRAKLSGEKDKLYGEKDKLYGEKDKLSGVLIAMHQCVQDVEGVLRVFSGMSQAEQTFGEGGHTETNNAISSMVKQHVPDNSNLAGSDPKAKKVLDDRMILDHSKYLSDFNQDSATTESYKSLQKVAKAYEEWILKSRIISPQSKDAGDKISEGVEWMKKTLNKGAVPASPGHATEFLYFPSPMSGEVNCAQTAFCGLLECIGDSWRGACQKDLSPFKVSANQNQIVPPTDLRRRRIVDIAVDKPGRFLLVMLDHALKLCFELKPLFRVNCCIEQLHLQSGDQVVASLAKFAFEGLRKFGVGMSTKATSLTGTIVYISVYELNLLMKEAELSGANKNGLFSDFVKLQLLESKKLPLMTVKALDSWNEKFVKLQLNSLTMKVEELKEKVKADKENQTKLLEEVKEAEKAFEKKKEKIMKGKQQQELNDLKEDLFGLDGKGGVDSQGIPTGIRVIWELMAKRREQLFGPDYKRFLGSNVGERLGTGAFGIVFSVADQDNAVLKVPLLPSAVHFRRERAILKELQLDVRKTKVPSDLPLPVLKEERELPFSIGGVHKSMPALLLEPKGQAILPYLRAADRGSKFLESVYADMTRALSYIHKKSVCHNDISPKNIIIMRGTEAGVRSCLVDFGCATGPGEKVKGFVGTTLYAHEDIFKKYPGIHWEPKGENDLFSLGLTMAALHNKGNAAWTMPRPKSGLDVAESAKKRCEIATKLLRESRCESKERWLELIEIDNVTKGQKRKWKAKDSDTAQQAKIPRV